MAKATLNKNGIATKAGDLTVYNYDGETRVFLTTSTEFLAVGVGIPANSCTDAPPGEKEGFAICRAVSFDGWEYVVDHRGETVYDTATGEPADITTPGEYADNVTTIAPSTPFDTWNGSAWITDVEAQHRVQVQAAEIEKATLLKEAQGTISIWQTELQLGIIGEDDKACLIAWIKYIQALNAVDTATGSDVVWPVKPE